MADQWWETVGGLLADMDADLRADAYEVFLAEAARSRLTDRQGEARLRVRSGETIVGTLVTDEDSRVEGHLVVRSPGGRESLVPEAAVVSLVGSRPGLRADDVSGRRTTVPSRLTSRLREAWLAGGRVRVLVRDGRWLDGEVVCVGADFADIACDGSVATVPLRSADVWQVG